MPPGAINWNDADDNNAFHAKTIVMDLDGSISTEVAIIANKQHMTISLTIAKPERSRFAIEMLPQSRSE